MKFWILSIFVAYAVASVTALKCITCKNAMSFETCDLEGKQQCMENQNLCETVIRRYNNHLRISKGCKNPKPHRNYPMPNDRPSGKSTKCNGDEVSSFCTCVCEGDSCNTGLDSCIFPISVPTSLQVGHNNCPAPPQSFPHGKINCENGVCKYQCTSPIYELWPAGRDQNVCGSDGHWQYDTPCCARPCPPYVLYDSLSLYHFKPGSIENAIRTLTEIMGSVHVGPESTILAGLSFGYEPVESSVIHFKDGYNINSYGILFGERLQTFQDGTLVNTGAAIQYAIDNMFRPELGMRNHRVSKTISIFTDSNPDDDVQTASENARNLGYIIYVYAFEREGVVFDDDRFLEITGDPKHIFKFGKNFDSFPDTWWKDLQEHFCQDPCAHALHDHEL